MRAWINAIAKRAGCFVIGITLAAVIDSASACSPVNEDVFVPDSKFAVDGETAPAAPAARVLRIQRGHRARRDESNCAETASIIIAIRDDSPGLPYGFSFAQVSGTTPDAIFPGGVFLGGRSAEGERLFVFHWPDLAPRKPAALNFVVRITPFTRSGIAGAPTDLAIHDDGT